MGAPVVAAAVVLGTVAVVVQVVAAVEAEVRVAVEVAAAVDFLVQDRGSSARPVRPCQVRRLFLSRPICPLLQLHLGRLGRRVVRVVQSCLEVLCLHLCRVVQVVLSLHSCPLVPFLLSLRPCRVVLSRRVFRVDPLGLVVQHLQLCQVDRVFHPDLCFQVDLSFQPLPVSHPDPSRLSDRVDKPCTDQAWPGGTNPARFPEVQSLPSFRPDRVRRSNRAHREDRVDRAGTDSDRNSDNDRNRLAGISGRVPRTRPSSCA